MDFVTESFLAGIVASIACGLGALPVLIPGLQIERRIGVAYAFAGGLMFAASVYNLLLPAFTVGPAKALELLPVIKTLGGVLAGCLFLGMLHKFVDEEKIRGGVVESLGGRTGALIFFAMVLHSIPEGVAVGVGYASGEHSAELSGLGLYIAVAIAIHNIPEGLAVALPLRSNGASFWRCFWMAFLTSLPQPLAAVPAALAVWFFEPLMLPLFGFAAGAMMFLVIAEIIPKALEEFSTQVIAWSFMLGFSLMVLVQVVL